MGDIGIRLEPEEFLPGSEFAGRVTVGFPGRYDGVVINAQVLDSNELITYRSYNGRRISRNVARLFVDRGSVRDGAVEFTASLEFVPEAEKEVKFRASIIEQHKEIGSAIAFGRLLAP